MTDDVDHGACVDAWLEGLAAAPARVLLAAFERAFGVVWRRAGATLGDVTLLAIGARVVHDARLRFPDVPAPRLHEGGVDCASIRDVLGGAARAEDVRGFSRFMLTELLGVLGDLTADALTPALHAALVAERSTKPERRRPPRARARDDDDDQGEPSR